MSWRSIRRQLGYGWGMPTPTAVEIVLSADERAQLESWERRRNSAQALAERSRIVLAAAEGLKNTEIAERLGVGREMVTKWRNRFAQYRLDGLSDEPRPGRPRTVSDDQVEAVITDSRDHSERDALVHPVVGRRVGDEPVGGVADLAGVRIGAAQTGFVETVQGSAVRGQGPRRGRAVLESTRAGVGALC